MGSTPARPIQVESEPRGPGEGLGFVVSRLEGI